MPIYGTTREVRVALVIVAALALSNSGCLLIAAGGATGYAYYKGKACRIYAAVPPDVWQATHAALADLGMNVDNAENTHQGGLIISHTTNGKKVKIYVDPHKSPVPVDGPMTCVTVRAALFGNEELSARLLNQIAVHLAPPPMMGPVPPGGNVMMPQAVPGNLPPGLPPPVRSVAPSPPSVPPPVANGTGTYNPTQQ